MRKIVLLFISIISVCVYANDLLKVSIPVDDIRTFSESDIIAKATIVKIYESHLPGTSIDEERYYSEIAPMIQVIRDRVKNEDNHHSFYKPGYFRVVYCSNEKYLQYTPSDTIYKVFGEELEPCVVFDFGKHKFKDDVCDIHVSLYPKYLKSHSGYAGFIENVLQLSDNLITFRYHYNNNLVTTLYNLESGSIINGYIKNEVFNSSYFPQTYSFKDGVLILHIDAINPYNENAVIFFSQDELKTLRDLKTNNRNAHIAIKFEYKNL